MKVWDPLQAVSGGQHIRARGWKLCIFLYPLIDDIRCFNFIGFQTVIPLLFGMLLTGQPNQSTRKEKQEISSILGTKRWIPHLEGPLLAAPRQEEEVSQVHDGHGQREVQCYLPTRTPPHKRQKSHTVAGQSRTLNLKTKSGTPQPFVLRTWTSLLFPNQQV